MKFVSILLLATFVSGCAVPSINKQVMQLVPITIKDKKTSTISVSKITDAVSNKDAVGKYYGGIWCLPKGDLFWSPNSKTISKLDDILRIKLENNGYSLLGKAYSPFKEEFNKQSDLLLGAKISEVRWNACNSINGAKGEIFLKVDWEVFSNKTKTVILTITTDGLHAATEFVGTGDSIIVESAFSMAADNLLANETFYKLLTANNQN